MNKQHGYPFDRGSADYYYGRRPEPHYWPAGTNKGHKVTKDQMTPEEIAEYWAGYEEAEELGYQKEW